MTDAMVSRAEYLRMQAVADGQHAKHMNALIERDIAIEHARTLRDHTPHVSLHGELWCDGDHDGEQRWPCPEWTRASEAIDED